MKNSMWILHFLLGMTLTLGVYSCSMNKDTPIPQNPYDTIIRDSTTQAFDTLSPNSITALHRDIFYVKCATPGCHDGTFEPDFRTVFSTWSTLVYQPVIKNTPDLRFQKRVIPREVENSWLYERLTTGDNVLGRMPLYSSALSEEELSRIRSWINEGAADPFGKLPIYPDTKPSLTFYYATNTTYSVDFGANRMDNVPYNAMLLPNNTDILIVPIVKDETTPLKDLQKNTLVFSYDPDQFSTPIASIPANYFEFEDNSFWIAQWNTSLFTPGRQVFMRYYVNDGTHVQDTVFPENESILPYKTFWSFVVTP